MNDYGEMFYGTLPQDTQDFRGVLAGIARTIRDRALGAGQSIIESGERARALQAQAFANPQNPLQITDPRALQQLTDMIMAGPMGFAPAGITKASSGLLPEQSFLSGTKQISQNLEQLGVKADMFEKDNLITLSRIVVPKEQRNQGIGTDAIQQIVDYADQTGKRIALSPSSDFGGSKERLKEFYKRFGFVENKGRNKDFTISDSMYREPK